MSEYRCPEPKPIVILALGLAGGSSRALEEATFGWIADFPLSLQRVGGSCLEGALLGAAIGVGIAVSKQLVFRLIATALVALPAFYLGRALYQLTYMAEFHVYFNYLWVIMALINGSAMALGMTLAHHEHLRRQGHRVAVITVILLYLASGGVMQSINVASGNEQIASGGFITTISLEFFPWGLATGATFGLLQYLAMIFALAVDRRQQRGGAETVNVRDGP